MEPEAALVGADGGIELNPVAVVHLNLTLVVHPGHPEHHSSLRGGQTLQQSVPAVGLFVLLDDGAQGFQHLVNCLIKFGLIRVLLPDTGQCFVNITHIQTSSIERF